MTLNAGVVRIDSLFVPLTPLILRKCLQLGTKGFLENPGQIEFVFSCSEEYFLVDGQIDGFAA
jgi:hypothetical protein